MNGFTTRALIMDENEVNILNPAKIASRDIAAIYPAYESAQGITICWNIGKRCNYACSYCGKELHDWTSPDRTFEQLVKAWLRLKAAVKPSGGTSRLLFTGGEPTLNPDFSRFVEFLSQTQRQWVKLIGVTTNGSEGFEYYDALLQNIDSITFSTHFEWWDENEFMTLLLDIWRRSGKNRTGKWISVNLMFEKWASSGIQKIRNVLMQEDIPWTSYKVMNVYGSKGITNKHGKSFDYSDYLCSRGEAVQSEARVAISTDNLTEVLLEDIQIGKNLDLDVILKDGSVWKADSLQMLNFGLANFPGWECHVHKSLYIHNDGVLWAGNCKFQKLGNVYETIKPLLGPVICDGRLCICTIDIQIEKHNRSPGKEIDVPLYFRREWLDRDPKNQPRTTGIG